MTAAFPFVEVTGAPYERGRAHGVAAADRIGRGVALYTGRLRGMGLDWAATRDLVGRIVPGMADFSLDHVTEMRGIAAGANQEFAAIVLLNARTEVLQMARRQARLDGEGCTTAVVLPARGADGRLRHAQNWDWSAACADTAIVLCVRRDDGPDVLTFTEAGALARHGLNGAGLALTGNYLRSDRDKGESGVPLPLIRRRAFECADRDAAIRLIAETPKSVSNNMTISHADGWAVDLECAPDASFALAPEDGLIVHANHWESPEALAVLTDAGVGGDTDTVFRAARVRSLLGAEGPLDETALRAAFLDAENTPHCVCQPAREWEPGDIGATVATLVMDPGAGTMDVAPMPASGARFTRYGLSGLVQPLAA